MKRNVDAMDNSSDSSILKSAAGQWVDTHGDFLYGYALLRVGDPKIAEVLLQRTLESGLTERNKIQEQTSERAWLISILKREIIDHFREVICRRPFEPSVMQNNCVQEFFSDNGKWLEKPVPWYDASSKAVQRKAFAHAFYVCLKQIPSPLAQVFVLREQEGLEIRKICSVTKNSKADVCAMLYRARLLLHRCLTRKYSCGEKVENSV